MRRVQNHEHYAPHHAHNAITHDTDNEVTMYMSEMLVREQHSERLKQAREARLARQASELRHLRRLQRRAQRQLREVNDRAEELGVTISAAS
jgi:hypothetical protein